MKTASEWDEEITRRLQAECGLRAGLAPEDEARLNELEKDKYQARWVGSGDLPAKLSMARFLAEILHDTQAKEAEALFREVLADLGAPPARTEEQQQEEQQQEQHEATAGTTCGWSKLPRYRRQLAGRAHAWFAVFLEGRPGRADECEAQYAAALAADPTQPLAMGNYAVLKHKVRRDRRAASGLFERAVLAHPTHVSILVKYAGFKKAALADLAGAEALYRSAAATDPRDADAAGALATFLHAHGCGDGVGDSDCEAAALAMYERAYGCDPTHANNLSNFGLFLSDVKGDAAGAEQLYKEALAAEPGHANALYNYAVLLDSGDLGGGGGLLETTRGGGLSAEAMYRQVLMSEPKHSYALYNLAVLLEERLKPQTPQTNHKPTNRPTPKHTQIAATAEKNKRGSSSAASSLAGVEARSKCAPASVAEEEVLALYRRAVDATGSQDSLSVADLGRFLLVRMRDFHSAEPALSRALSLDPLNAVALYHLGLFHADAPGEEEGGGEDTAGATPRKGKEGRAAEYEDQGDATLSKGGGDGGGGGPEKAAALWRTLVDESDPSHIMGLRRLARLEMERLGRPKEADRRYLAALNAAHAKAKNHGDAKESLRGGGGGGGWAELESLAEEVLEVMAPAPSRVDAARASATKLRRIALRQMK